MLKKLYWSAVEFKPSGPNVWDVHNSKGKVDGFKVIFKGGRYRFEDE